MKGTPCLLTRTLTLILTLTLTLAGQRMGGCGGGRALPPSKHSASRPPAVPDAYKGAGQKHGVRKA